jgi:hypothetical protein
MVWALPLLAVDLGLLQVSDLAHHPLLTLGLLGSAFLWLPFAARRTESAAGTTSRAIWLSALILRLALMPLPLTLSDDALRYLWDGKVASAGFNPYALPPVATELIPLHDDMWLRLPHTDVPTVYPPLALTAFSIASRLPFPLLAWKALATAADLAACALLLALARRRGLSPGRTVWYAWNPLVALEVAGMGHVDALGVAAMVGAVLCLTPRPRAEGAEERRTPLSAGLWAAAGVLAKLAPLAALPMWARQSGRPVRFLAVALGLTAAAALPVLLATGGVPPGLVRYGLTWEFNGPLFEPLWRLLDAAGAAPALARGVDRLKEWTEMWEAWNPVYPYLYPQLLAKAVLGAGMVAAVARSLRDRDPVAGTGRLFGALLLLSATVYPWYLLWVLPWAALARHTAWRALSALILLSYLPKIAGVPLMPWVFLSIWIPFGVLLVVGEGWGPHPPAPSPATPPTTPGEGEQERGWPEKDVGEGVERRQGQNSGDGR